MPFREHRLPNDKSEQNFCKMSNDGIISDSFLSLLLSIIVLVTKKSHGCRKNAVNLSPTRGLSTERKDSEQRRCLQQHEEGSQVTVYAAKVACVCFFALESKA